ncbi:MAG: SDR family NAD(P)-dependent oxidoreductase, partial [Acidimicrobiales bacterium]
LYDGPKVSPDEMAAGILAAMESESFEHYVPDMKSIIEMKTADPDTFLRGMADMARTAKD